MAQAKEQNHAPVQNRAAETTTGGEKRPRTRRPYYNLLMFLMYQFQKFLVGY